MNVMMAVFVSAIVVMIVLLRIKEANRNHGGSCISNSMHRSMHGSSVWMYDEMFSSF